MCEYNYIVAGLNEKVFWCGEAYDTETMLQNMLQDFIDNESYSYEDAENPAVIKGVASQFRKIEDVEIYRMKLKEDDYLALVDEALSDKWHLELFKPHFIIQTEEIIERSLSFFEQKQIDLNCLIKSIELTTDDEWLLAKKPMMSWLGRDDVEALESQNNKVLNENDIRALEEKNNSNRDGVKATLKRIIELQDNSEEIAFVLLSACLFSRAYSSRGLYDLTIWPEITIARSLAEKVFELAFLEGKYPWSHSCSWVNPKCEIEAGLVLVNEYDILDYCLRESYRILAANQMVEITWVSH